LISALFSQTNPDFLSVLSRFTNHRFRQKSTQFLLVLL